LTPLETLRAQIGRFDREDPEVEYDNAGRPLSAIVRIRQGRRRAIGAAWSSELTSGIARKNARTVLVLRAEERALTALANGMCR